MDQRAKAIRLLELHAAPEPLVLINVWDVISARVVAGLKGCQAIATASHSIAATLGYEDGEQIPLDEMIMMVGRIAAAVDLPVTADLEAGYGDVGETIRRAIGVGVVGANIEDQLAPFDSAVTAVSMAIAAAQSEGVDFVLNARTDVFLRDGDPDAQIEEAVRRGRAFLDAGAACVFVPGRLDASSIGRLVEGIGERRVSVIGYPHSVPLEQLAALGVARISYGPWSQRVALTALAATGGELLAGTGLPADVRLLT